MSAAASAEPESSTSSPPIANEDASMGERALKEEDKELDGMKPVNVEKTKEVFQMRARNYLIDQSSHIVVPSFSKWFNMNEIHQIEKKLFPDFFPAKDQQGGQSPYKNAEIYKNMRDFMVNVYRINPLEYLTVTAIRRNLAGDVASIIRIHQFLEKWGLINYQVDPRTKSSTVGAQYTGHFQVTLDTPKGMVPFIPEGIETVYSRKPQEEQATGETHPNGSIGDEKEIKKEDEHEIPINLEVRRNIYSFSNEASKNPSNQNIIQYFCNVCGKDASNVRHYNLKTKSYSNNPNSTANNATILCNQCYEQGLFPLNFLSTDFVKMEEESDSKWSEQEVLLLLEGIEMFGNFDESQGNPHLSFNSSAGGQWEKISDFIGTKSKEQCLVKFLELPIEDRFLNKMIKRPKKDAKIDRQQIIEDIVERLVSKQAGKDLIKENSLSSLHYAITEQSSLINQIIELTIQKFEAKLERFNNLESDLMQIERSLNSERKQVLLERWNNFEKVRRFRESHKDISPEVDGLLSDLLKPVNISQINDLAKVSGQGQEEISNQDDKKLKSELEEAESEKLPISFVKPSTYKFWSG